MNTKLHKKRRSLGVAGSLLSGFVLLGIILATPHFLALPDAPSSKQAERLVRLYFKKQAGESYKGDETYRERSSVVLDELNQIDELRFKSVDVGRLLPDYYLSHDEPSYFTKVVYVDSAGLQETRYFSLGSGDHVLAERSRYLWLFVL